MCCDCCIPGLRVCDNVKSRKYHWLTSYFFEGYGTLLSNMSQINWQAYTQSKPLNARGNGKPALPHSHALLSTIWQDPTL
jgi:hypothetical protein